MGLVGESGSGKSTPGAIPASAPVTGGSIRFDGRDIVPRPCGASALAADVQVVFQDPYGSLNPAMTIGDILSEPLLTSGLGGSEAQARVREMLDRVRLPETAMDRYPSEFSGGSASASPSPGLSCAARLIVCDEPVSALDLTTQATILDLFIELQRDTGVSYLFVSHDLGVVRRVCHRVAVMYHGEIVETGAGSRSPARRGTPMPSACAWLPGRRPREAEDPPCRVAGAA
jgi:ABC-type glutathione transport system ATPase component